MHLSRRQFTLALGSVALAGAGRAAVSGAERPLRAAVIGHTGRGDYGHGLDRIFVGLPGVEIVAVADPEESGRQRVAAALGVQRSYADWKELLAREKPQLVSVAMRQADQHAEIGRACLRAGAHVFMEKPFVMSPDEADVMLAEAAQGELKIAVAHTMRLMPAVQHLLTYVREGKLGELLELRAYGKQDARAGGEDLMVLGTHLFDLMRLFAGDPLWCSARVQVGERDITVADRRQVQDNVGWVAGDRITALFAFPGSVTGTFRSDARRRELTGHWGLELHGSRGVARINCDLQPRAYLRSAAPWTAAGRTEEWRPLEPLRTVSAEDHLIAPVRDWLEAIEADREPQCSGRNGAWAVEMVAAVYASALAGGRVSFPLKPRRHPLAT